MSAKFEYLVKVGRVPGIYKTWEECAKQVKGFSGAVFHKVAKDAETKLTTHVGDAAATIYCDGSCATNKNAGFSAIDWIARRAYFGCKKNATNNIAELLGVQLALATIKSQKYPAAVVYCDSQYAINVVTGTYSAQKNKELVAEIAAEYSALAKVAAIKLEWVRGHAGREGNECADKYAKKGAELTDECTKDEKF